GGHRAAPRRVVPRERLTGLSPRLGADRAQGPPPQALGTVRGSLLAVQEAARARPNRVWAGYSSSVAPGTPAVGPGRADAVASWEAWAAPAWPSRRVAGIAPRREWSRRVPSDRDRAHSRRPYAAPVSPAWLGSRDRGTGG